MSTIIITVSLFKKRMWLERYINMYYLYIKYTR